MESLIMDGSFALDCNFLFDGSVVAFRKCWQISLLEDSKMKWLSFFPLPHKFAAFLGG